MDFFYRCSECGRRLEIGPEVYLCPNCSAEQEEGRPLRGVLEVDWEGVPRTAVAVGPPQIPDLFDLLPIPREYFPVIPVGRTPLWAAERLRKATGLPQLYLKDDGLNPTFSFKDRASWLVAAAARMWDVSRVTVASTGNAASSMAGVGAAAGLDVTVFAPATAPQAKLVQCRQYGAEVVTVEGGYREAYRRSLEFTARVGGINRNTAYNPLTIEGKKSVAFEIARELPAPPDYVFVPTGDGVILSGVYKGLCDLVRIGALARVPVVVAVQAEGSNALAQALDRRRAGTGALGHGSASVPLFGEYTADTLADSIAVDVPAAGYYAVEQLVRHDGRAVVVPDDAILEAQHVLASRAGLFAEPAAAAAWAGLEAMRSDIPSEATVVVLLTGSGLKDVDAAARLFAAE